MKADASGSVTWAERTVGFGSNYSPPRCALDSAGNTYFGGQVEDLGEELFVGKHAP